MANDDTRWRKDDIIEMKDLVGDLSLDPGTRPPLQIYTLW